MKLYMRITANTEIDVDPEAGTVNNIKLTSTELYSSEDLVNWTMLGGGEFDDLMTEKMKRVFGLNE